MATYSDTQIKISAAISLLGLGVASIMYFHTQKDAEKLDKILIGIGTLIMGFAYIMVIMKPYSENTMRTFFMLTAGFSTLILFRIAKNHHSEHKKKTKKKKNDKHKGKSTETKFVPKKA